jgi:GrpB-like predicted nucleotidyltransferase (UPF0157 family)
VADNPDMTSVAIVEYDPDWPQAFLDVGRALRTALGEAAERIDHIGSTSVPGLAAKDVIDIQVSVASAANLDASAALLEEAGWVAVRAIVGDHPVPGWPSDDNAARKVLLRERSGRRRVNVHVRVAGGANQRYPLLVRDYLRTHPHSAHAYETLKRDLAALVSDDPGRYADVKDPACDLIYFAAQDWALANAWTPGPPDA